MATGARPRALPGIEPDKNLIWTYFEAMVPKTMPKSLIEQLPGIVQEGRKEAERILEGLEGKSRVSLYTRELVLPAKRPASTRNSSERTASQRRRGRTYACVGSDPQFEPFMRRRHDSQPWRTPS